MVERTPILTFCCHALLLLGVAAVLLPLYFAFVAASLSTAEVQQIPLPLLPGDQLIENARLAWSKANLGRLFLNSAVVAIGITVGKLTISMLSAFAISYFRFRFRRTAFWLIFCSLMLPVEVRIGPTYESVANVLLPLQWLLDGAAAAAGLRMDLVLELSLLDSYGGLILPLVASATATFLFRQFFMTVPDEVCEAARLDGASPMRFFRSILLPMSLPNIAALGIILFLYGWNQYLWPLLATSGRDMATVVIGIKQLIPTADQQPAWNLAMNAALMAMLPPVLVVVALQRWFVKGLVDPGK